MKTKHLVAVAVVTCLVMGNTQAAVSTPGTAEAKFDWSTFSVTGYSTGVAAAASVTWNELSQETSIYANTFIDGDEGLSDNAVDWNSTLAINTGNTATNANSNASATILHSFSSDQGVTDGSSAEGYIQRMGNFSAVGSGLLVFSVGYTLDVSTPESAETTDPTSNSATVKFVINPTEASQVFTSEDNVTVGQWHPGSDQRNGTLSLALLVQDGQQFSFNARAETRADVTAAVVPLPQAVWLFGAGLMGLLSIAKRSRFI